MTGARLLLWVLISVLSTSALFGLSLAAFAAGRGNWAAFFQSPARVGALVVSLALAVVAVFSGFGGMNPGKKEDRGNRWIFGPIIALSLGMALLPPFLDGRNLWTAYEAVTPYVGLALLAGKLPRLGRWHLPPCEHGCRILDRSFFHPRSGAVTTDIRYVGTLGSS